MNFGQTKQDIINDSHRFNQESTKYKLYVDNYTNLKSVDCTDIIINRENIDNLAEFNKHENFAWFEEAR